MGNPNENGSLRKEGSVSVETASLGALGGESQLQLCRELWGAGEGVFGVPQGAVGCRESPPVPAGSTWTPRERSCSAMPEPSAPPPREPRAPCRRFTTR